MFVAFLAACFLLGGSARADVTQLVLLRPLGWLFVGYALVVGSREDFAQVRAPLLLLGTLGILLLVQVVPLPPAIWTSLPTHSLVETVAAQAGLGDVWRPISLLPGATANALFSLGVPLAAILLVAIQSPEYRRKVWTVVLVIALVSALLGLAQLFGGRGSPLYFYPIANVGSPIGFFANRNHHGVFLAAMVVVACGRIAQQSLQRDRRSSSIVLPAAVAMLAVPVLLASESRAGILALALAAIAGGYLLVSSGAVPPKLRLGRRASIPTGLAMFGVVIAAVAAFALLFLMAGGMAADEMAGLTDESYDLRFQVLPTVAQMAVDALPMGIGVGAFTTVYAIYEPDGMVEARYLNHAHNDWLQPVIELGAGGFIIGLALFAWMAARGVRTWRLADKADRLASLIAWVVLAILILASAVDYPLRAPALMAVAGIAAAMCCLRDPTRSLSRKSKRSSVPKEFAE